MKDSSLLVTMEEFVHILAESQLALVGHIDLGEVLGCLIEIVVDALLAKLTDAYLVVQASDGSHLDITIEGLCLYPTSEFGTLFVVCTVIGIDELSPPTAFPNTFGSP